MCCRSATQHWRVPPVCTAAWLATDTAYTLATHPTRRNASHPTLAVYKSLYDGVQVVAAKVLTGLSDERMFNAFLREVRCGQVAALQLCCLA